ncbi:MAG: redoxin domain-containing protein [Deltaproteobacteria bacterium]|nr:redoxin domain-containing protein [Deltaproteobacteria bacterium]MBW2302096.1 redoxin domain-containing protein [Deltaproteobacteria bacterium]
MGTFSGLLSLIWLIGISALSVGDKAPSLEGTLWLQGQEVTFEKPYTVLEFWATWCPACRSEIPHLARIQSFYEDQVRVVGLSDEPSNDLARFLKGEGKEISYGVGKVTHEVRRRYMDGTPGVPYAFLVDKTRTVIWEGHPSDLDEVLDKALAGRLDIERVKRISSLEKALRETLKTNDMEIVAQAADALLALDPANERGLRVRTVVAKKQKDPAALRAMYDRLDPKILKGAKANRLARDLITEKELPFRYVGAALKLAARAVEMEPENGLFAHTYARVQYCLGNLDKAIAWERRALKLDPGEKKYRDDLDYYLSVKKLREGCTPRDPSLSQGPFPDSP